MAAKGGAWAGSERGRAAGRRGAGGGARGGAAPSRCGGAGAGAGAGAGTRGERGGCRGTAHGGAVEPGLAREALHGRLLRAGRRGGGRRPPGGWRRLAAVLPLPGREGPGATSTGKPQRWEGEGKREGTSSGRLVLNHCFV